MSVILNYSVYCIPVSTSLDIALSSFNNYVDTPGSQIFENGLEVNVVPTTAWIMHVKENPKHSIDGWSSIAARARAF